jgi:hypothetical protein
LTVWVNATVTDRASLEIDFGARSASWRSQGPVEFRAGSAAQVSCPINGCQAARAPDLTIPDQYALTG